MDRRKRERDRERKRQKARMKLNDTDDDNSSASSSQTNVSHQSRTLPQRKDKDTTNLHTKQGEPLCTSISNHQMKLNDTDDDNSSASSSQTNVSHQSRTLPQRKDKDTTNLHTKQGEPLCTPISNQQMKWTFKIPLLKPRSSEERSEQMYINRKGDNENKHFCKQQSDDQHIDVPVINLEDTNKDFPTTGKRKFDSQLCMQTVCKRVKNDDNAALKVGEERRRKEQYRRKKRVENPQTFKDLQKQQKRLQRYRQKLDNQEAYCDRERKQKAYQRGKTKATNPTALKDYERKVKAIQRSKKKAEDPQALKDYERKVKAIQRSKKKAEDPQALKEYEREVKATQRSKKKAEDPQALRDYQREDKATQRSKKKAEDSQARKVYQRQDKATQRSKKKAEDPQALKDYEREVKATQRSKKKAEDPQALKDYQRQDKATQRSKKKAEDPQALKDYQRQDKATQRHRLKSIDPKGHKESELSRKIQYRQRKKLMSDLTQNFNKKIKEGPIYICCSCQMLLYKKSVRIFNRKDYDSKCQSLVDVCTASIKSYDDVIYICTSCHRKLCIGQIPPLSTGNNLNLSEIPDALKDLSSLEVTLISKRVPFMKILALPRGKQKAVHGCVVNVPVDPDETCGVLPRFPSSCTLTVKLKRKLQYRGHTMKQVIRPWKILNALYYLKHNNKHYQDVAINDHWQEDCDEENTELWQSLTTEDKDSDSDSHFHIRKNIDDRSELTEDSYSKAHDEIVGVDTQVDKLTQNKNDTAVNNKNRCSDEKQNHNNKESDDNDSENDEEEMQQDVRTKLAGFPYDSCLQPKDLSTESDFILSLAPGEGKKPQSFYSDIHSEELAFPNLFPNGSFAYSHDRPKKLTLKQYFKSRILNHDTRFSSCIEYLFYAQYRCEAKAISDCLSIALRKCKGDMRTNKITAGQIKEADILRQLARNDLSYHFLQKVRGSPAYYNHMMYDLFGMIRHLGACTWFLTLSAADMRWTDTIQIIGKQHGENFSDEYIQSMTWEQKSHWLRSNPVSAARHFDYRLQLFVHEVLCSPLHPVGEILDFKYRIEFQQRGSPHAHMVIWIKNAPTITKDSTVSVQHFIDKYVTCALPVKDSSLQDLVESVQTHTHSVACQKKGKTCRFGFPLPALDQTIVFLPLQNPPPESVTKQYTDILHKVQASISEVKLDSAITLKDILGNLDISLDDYLSAIHWLKTKNGQPAVLLQRTPAENRINYYNADLLSAWAANMDIQFVTNVYACVMYVASYISKPEKTLGDILKSVSKTCEPLGAKVKMQRTAKKFLTHREVSAQEAVYRLLSLPLSKSSRSVVFIPTNLPENRTYLLKPLKVIQAMEDDDDDLVQKGIIDRYINRPTTLETMCFADFSSRYRSSCTKSTEESDLLQDIEINEQTEHQVNLPEVIYLKNDSRKMTLRKRPVIIRTHQFSKDKTPEEYYHSKLMLYYPWRDECTDLKSENGTYETKFQEVFHELESNLLLHEPNSYDVEDAARQLEENGPPEDAWAQLAAQVEQHQEDDRREGSKTHEDHVHLDTQHSVNPQDIGLIRYEYEVNTNQVSRQKWLQMTCALNEEQKKVHKFIVEWCAKMTLNYRSKNKPKPFHLFLTGGAGVGKSHLVRTIQQTANRLLNIGQTEDELVVVVAAFTGVAAFNIGGQTLHSLFQMPVFERKHADYIPLASEQLARVKAVLGNLCLLIIDEISFISSDFLLTIHRRLTDIMACNEPFGGISVLAVGDLFQLPPVARKPVFMPYSCDPLANLYGSLWCNLFRCVHLDTIMRQKDDLLFAQTLNRIRIGQATLQDITLIRSREVEKSSQQYPRYALHIFPTNHSVDQHNMETLETLATTILTLRSTDTKKDKETGQISEIQLGQKEGQLLGELKLAEGARVSLTVNIDQTDGLVNSASGTITGFHPTLKQDDPNYKPKYILVEFDDVKCGGNTRAKLKNIFGNTRSTPIKEITVDVRKKQLTVHRTQFPLTLAWASTIHKAQGKTLDQLVVCNVGTYRAGQMYTALSRVKTLGGLFILNGFSANSIKVNAEVVTEINRLASRQLKVNNSQIASLPCTFLKMTLLNINSLAPHFDCLQSDDTFQHADIIFLTETWLQETDQSNYNLSSEYTIHRCDRKPKSMNINPHGGVAIQVHHKFHVRHHFPHEFPVIDSIALLLEHRDTLDRILVICIYNSPITKLRLFLHAIDKLLSSLPIHHGITILAGDFNINHLVENHELKKLQTVTQYYGFSQYVTTPSHRSGSLLDHIYVNKPVPDSIVTTTPVHYTDHLLVEMAIPIQQLLHR